MDVLATLLGTLAVLATVFLMFLDPLKPRTKKENHHAR